MKDIYTRYPVNGTASMVINQCGCADEFEFNSLKEERDQLKANVKLWSNGKGRGSRKNKSLLVEANKRLGLMNRKLKPYDEWYKRNNPQFSDYALALRFAIKMSHGDDFLKDIEDQAKKYYRYEEGISYVSEKPSAPESSRQTKSKTKRVA